MEYQEINHLSVIFFLLSLLSLVTMQLFTSIWTIFGLIFAVFGCITTIIGVGHGKKKLHVVLLILNITFICIFTIQLLS